MRSLRVATAVLALAGVAVAGYLTWVHYAALQPFCVGGGQACERVQTSEYAQFAGIPVALLGLAAYVAVLASLALPDALGRPFAAFLTLTGLAFSGYLTYLEVAEIHAICQWCVASAVIMAGLAAVSVARLLRFDEPLPAV